MELKYKGAAVMVEGGLWEHLILGSSGKFCVLNQDLYLNGLFWDVLQGSKGES